MHVVQKEIIYHIQCCNCEKHWTISKQNISDELSCPWCSQRSYLEHCSDTITQLDTITERSRLETIIELLSIMMGVLIKEYNNKEMDRVKRLLRSIKK